MRSLTFKIVMPLTVILFATFTKWWYALPVDALETGYKFVWQQAERPDYYQYFPKEK